MNQDQARRMAEEALPSLMDSLRATLSTVRACETKTAAQLRLEYFTCEAIASALVKLTQGQEPVAEVLSNRVGNDTSTIDKALPAGTKLYTIPAPSQQEERKPLTDEFIATLHYGCSTALKFARAIEAAHNINEQP